MTRRREGRRGEVNEGVGEVRPDEGGERTVSEGKAWRVRQVKEGKQKEIRGVKRKL